MSEGNKRLAKTKLNEFLLAHDSYGCTYDNVPMELVEGGNLYHLMSSFGNHMSSLDVTRAGSNDQHYNAATAVKIFETAYLLWWDLYKPGHNNDFRDRIWVEDETKTSQIRALKAALGRRDIGGYANVLEWDHRPYYKEVKRSLTDWDKGMSSFNVLQTNYYQQLQILTI